MPDLRVSQLPDYPAILSPVNDAFLIVDTTNVASKKISPANLIKTFMFSGSTDPVAAPVVSPAIYQQTVTNVTWIYDGIRWRQISGGGGTLPISQVPYVQFNSSPVASSNQQFVSASFALYDNNVSWATVSINGVLMTPSVNYSLAGSVLTILDFLAPSALIEVAFKLVPLGTSSIATQDGDTLTTQQGDDFITN